MHKYAVLFLRNKSRISFTLPPPRVVFLLLLLVGCFLFCFVLPSEIPFCLKHMFLLLVVRHTLSDQEVEPFYSLKLKYFSNLLIFLTAVAQRVTRTAGVNYHVLDFTFNTKL